MDPVEVMEGQDRIRSWLSTPGAVATNEVDGTAVSHFDLYQCSTGMRRRGSRVYIPVDLITNEKKSSGRN
jgi:hypothetical protein